jgi:2-polyprenyl-3-methyl-5-hydroxy-6-metoxy-1,4-benzoquinol methylase
MKDKELLRTQQWPDDTVERVPACPICRSTSRTLLHADLADDTFFAAPGTWNMHQCGDCGSAYLDPRPTPQSIGNAYAQYYTHGSASPSASRGLRAMLSRQLQRFSDSYEASLTRSQSWTAAFPEALAAACVRVVRPWREVVDARYRHLRRPPVGADRLLDVGCGNGDLLQRAQSLGWKVEGFDFDPKAVAAAQAAGLKVRLGSIQLYSNTREAFDVVTCNHVIEHVHEPRQLLAAMHRVLKPGGRLWIETPNIGSIGHALFGSSWRGLETPRHLALFNHQSLVRMLGDSGFSVTHRTPFNIQHIRFVFASSEAIAAGRDPANARPPALLNWRLLRGLLLEALLVERREFVCLRATKLS